MHRPWLPLLLTVLVGAAWAGAAEKPKPGASSLVSEDEVDKPGKPGVPMPRALPTPPEAEQETKDDEKPDKPAFVNPRAARSRKPKYAEPTRVTWSDGKMLEGWSWRRANGPGCFKNFFNGQRDAEGVNKKNGQRLFAYGCREMLLPILCCLRLDIHENRF